MKWIFYIIIAIIALFQHRYRFNHPEMTETQLVLHFFDAFKE